MSRHAAVRTLLALALATVPLAGCTAPANTAQQPPAAQQPTASAEPQTLASEGPAGKIMFDMAHQEIFQPLDTSDLGQSSAVQRMQDAGYGVVVNTERITPQSLEGIAAVYLAGPMVPFTDAEKTALDDYLERGGTVVMTIHIPYPVLSSAARWGLPLGTGVMQSPQGLDPADAGVFVSEDVAEDPLTAGVRGITIFSGWPVFTDTAQLKTAKLAIKTAPDVVADTNGNQQFDEGDEKAPFGVVGVTTVGNGRVVILGDDAIFANMGIGAADNAVLFDNILKLISAPKGV